ncbi:cytosine deaminase domain protein [[Clostridium] sordellii ATCC 9714]|nr:cytosine deaminase domain protein [[Clostridium] sordellii ATCC 9714] [Paeniclostridium sordellii ATCC 9714]
MDGATNGTGTLFEGIQRWSETKSKMTVDEIKERARVALKKKYYMGLNILEHM